MAMRIRVFFFGDDGAITRVPLARFERLSNDEEVFAEHAGERVRCAMVFLEMHNRKPVGLYDIEFTIIPFDPEGRIDSAESQRAMRFAAETFVLPEVPVRENVIDIKPFLARKRHQEEFSWSPTEAELRSLIKSVWKK